MDFLFKDLVDVPILQALTDDLYAATGIPSAIITMDGEILTGSGWQRICTDFHRMNKELEAECIESDTRIRERLDQGERFVIYECPRGLVDASAPVVIEGVHVANVFAGQLFMEAPTAEKERLFREQAVKFGFDEDEYIRAFREIPVLPEDKFRPALRFLSGFAQLVASIGLARMREIQAMSSVTASERKYRRLLESTNMTAWERDLKTGDFTYVSPQAERLFGHPPSHFRDFDSWSSLVHPEDRDRSVRFSREEAALGRDHDLEYRALTRDGRTVWIHDSVTVVGGPEGPGALVGVMRDITAQKKAAEALRESERMAAMGSLVGSVAHEVRNPLFALSSTLDAFEVRLGTKDEQVESYLRRLREQVERVSTLMEELLDYGRPHTPQLAPGDVRPAVAQAVEWCGQIAEPNGVELRVRLPDTLPEILLDSARLARVFENVVKNAVQHSPKGAVVEIVVSEGPGPEGSEVVVAVHDSGPGFPAEALRLVFEPFFTLRRGGSGLGLSIAWRIVQEHKGEIEAANAPGGGGLVTVRLPACAPS